MAARAAARARDPPRASGGRTARTAGRGRRPGGRARVRFRHPRPSRPRRDRPPPPGARHVPRRVGTVEGEEEPTTSRDEVALDLGALTGRRGHLVECDRLGNEHGDPARSIEPPRQIHVLEVREERGLEPTHRLERRTAIEHATRGPSEDLPRAGERLGGHAGLELERNARLVNGDPAAVHDVRCGARSGDRGRASRPRARRDRAASRDAATNRRSTATSGLSSSTHSVRVREIPCEAATRSPR